MKTQLDKFYKHLHEIARFGGISALLGWDQQVNMPPKGAAIRSEQLELMSALLHQKQIDPEYINLVRELHENTSELGETDQVNVRETLRAIERKIKLPVEFVSRRAKLEADCLQKWQECKPQNDFASVAPLLTQFVDMCREEAELVGYEGHPYNALFDTYEPGAKIEEIKPVLLSLGESLQPIIDQIIDSQQPVAKTGLQYPIVMQKKLCEHVAAAFGFDFQSGRIDTAPHPFCTDFGLNDVRLTTRYDEQEYLSALTGVMHEVGHGLYEQGFLAKHGTTPMASSISLGIHESQSKLWESMVGRSKEFANYLHRHLQEFLPEEYNSASPESIWQRLNKVEKSPVRVEADEVTYSMHIIIRVLLEVDLIEGKLEVKDLPEAWNALYKKYLGLDIESDREGVLQDIHWYSGAIGYFSTYTLGDLYRGVFWEKINKDNPDIYQQIEKGEFQPLLGWLRTNVHEHGMHYGAGDLLQKVTGQSLSDKPFLNYVKTKFGL